MQHINALHADTDFVRRHYRETNTTIHEIQRLARLLRSGMHPTEPTIGAKRIGAGVQKTAYLYRDAWVIKTNTGGYMNPEWSMPIFLMRLGFVRPKQYRAGEWMIQSFHPAVGTEDRLSAEQYSMYLAASEANFKRYPQAMPFDIHLGNIGFGYDGTLVCFDW